MFTRARQRPNSSNADRVSAESIMCRSFGIQPGIVKQAREKFSSDTDGSSTISVARGSMKDGRISTNSQISLEYERFLGSLSEKDKPSVAPVFRRPSVHSFNGTRVPSFEGNLQKSLQNGLSANTSPYSSFRVHQNTRSVDRNNLSSTTNMPNVASRKSLLESYVASLTDRDHSRQLLNKPSQGLADNNRLRHADRDPRSRSANSYPRNLRSSVLSFGHENFDPFNIYRPRSAVFGTGVNSPRNADQNNGVSVISTTPRRDMKADDANSESSSQHFSSSQQSNASHQKNMSILHTKHLPFSYLSSDIAPPNLGLRAISREEVKSSDRTTLPSSKPFNYVAAVQENDNKRLSERFNENRMKNTGRSTPYAGSSLRLKSEETAANLNSTRTDSVDTSRTRQPHVEGFLNHTSSIFSGPRGTRKGFYSPNRNISESGRTSRSETRIQKNNPQSSNYKPFIRSNSDDKHFYDRPDRMSSRNDYSLREANNNTGLFKSAERSNGEASKSQRSTATLSPYPTNQLKRSSNLTEYGDQKRSQHFGTVPLARRLPVEICSFNRNVYSATGFDGRRSTSLTSYRPWMSELKKSSSLSSKSSVDRNVFQNIEHMRNLSSSNDTNVPSRYPSLEGDPRDSNSKESPAHENEYERKSRKDSYDHMPAISTVSFSRIPSVLKFQEMSIKNKPQGTTNGSINRKQEGTQQQQPADSRPQTQVFFPFEKTVSQQIEKPREFFQPQERENASSVMQTELYEKCARISSKHQLNNDEPAVPNQPVPPPPPSADLILPPPPPRKVSSPQKLRASSPQRTKSPSPNKPESAKPSPFDTVQASTPLRWNTEMQKTFGDMTNSIETTTSKEGGMQKTTAQWVIQPSTDSTTERVSKRPSTAAPHDTSPTQESEHSRVPSSAPFVPSGRSSPLERCTSFRSSGSAINMRPEYSQLAQKLEEQFKISTNLTRNGTLNGLNKTPTKPKPDVPSKVEENDPVKDKPEEEKEEVVEKVERAPVIKASEFRALYANTDESNTIQPVKKKLLMELTQKLAMRATPATDGLHSSPVETQNRSVMGKKPTANVQPVQHQTNVPPEGKSIETNDSNPKVPPPTKKPEPKSNEFNYVGASHTTRSPGTHANETDDTDSTASDPTLAPQNELGQYPRPEWHNNVVPSPSLANSPHVKELVAKLGARLGDPTTPRHFPRLTQHEVTPNVHPSPLLRPQQPAAHTPQDLRSKSPSPIVDRSIRQKEAEWKPIAPQIY